MTTWPEARAAKIERQRIERRFYTPDKLGRLCNYCDLKMPKALEALGYHAHPTCEPRGRSRAL